VGKAYQATMKKGKEVSRTHHIEVTWPDDAADTDCIRARFASSDDFQKVGEMMILDYKEIKGKASEKIECLVHHPSRDDQGKSYRPTFHPIQEERSKFLPPSCS
jgi:hypothetical protein